MPRAGGAGRTRGSLESRVHYSQTWAHGVASVRPLNVDRNANPVDGEAPYDEETVRVELEKNQVAKKDPPVAGRRSRSYSTLLNRKRGQRLCGVFKSRTRVEPLPKPVRINEELRRT